MKSICVITCAILLASVPVEAQLRKGPLSGVKKKQRQSQVLERFNQMAPEEQDKVLKTLPPDRRKQVEKNLDRYRQLNPEEKKQLQSGVEGFRSLPPEKQAAARKLFRRINQMPEERRIALRQEMARQRRMSEEDRKTRVGSEDYKSKYSEDERRVMGDLLELVPN